MQELSGCQATRGNLMSCSKRIFVPGRLHKLLWCLKNKGLWNTFGLVWRKITRRHDTSSRKAFSDCRVVTQSRGGESQALQPGEIVEVRSEREILETLDEHGKHRGLFWMPTMARFCGRRYRVYKRVKKVMLESSGELRSIRDTVLLEGVVCEDLYGCDRSCYHFWREAWLRRVPADREIEGGPDRQQAVTPGGREGTR
jgi:hypothetical protein